MQLSEAAGGPHTGGASAPAGAETCRFPKLEECAHFHYERVQLPALDVILQTSMDQSLHSQHTSDEDMKDWYTLQVTCRDECWLIQRSLENFAMLDAQLHQCIYDRKVSHLPEISVDLQDSEELEAYLSSYLHRFCTIVDNSLNCGPILNWFQLDNRGHRLLVPSEESRSINTPAVAAAYSIRKYVSQARDELSLEVGDMISVIDMASPGESVWWRGKRGFQVGFFPQHCVHIIGDKVPRNMPLPPPVVGSLALSPIKPVLRKHGKLITFFRSFILNRPSRRRLKQSGILKERVFGCDLGEHLLNSGHEIPMVLKCCAEFIESHGIVDGIYRLSGVTSNIQKLRNAFDEDRIPNLYTDEILQDIHSVASLLKMYFRELPNPLCTYQLYQSFVSAVQGCTASRNKANDNERLIKMREAVQKLPPPHYRTLEYLMRHLARVAKHGTNTGMTTRNVAIVWAPNLLRCEELEVGGVAALQGVGVQAVVTEFLVCYADLIFSDHLPNLPDTSTTPGGGDSLIPASPKRSRPKSLAISTPTKLLTLEEARNKHLLSKTDDCNYIEVGGGPKSLPKKYHTVIELPPGSRKRVLSKRSSPSGWRSFFSKSRNSSHGNLSKNREISTPGVLSTDSSITDSDLCDMKRKLRPVKSAESLTSGQSEPASCEIDVLGPLHCLSKPPGHNRSVSHDSYFDSLQPSTNNSVGSLLDLSEIQLNFELEESEMRIFSEDESLVSSPKLQKDVPTRKFLSRARPEDFSSAANSSNPSPKKQPRVVISPESLSRKRSRLEDQLSDIQYIDCTTPDNPCTISTTTAQIHQESLIPSSDTQTRQFEGYQPKNKSPRNSSTNRHSLNFEKIEKLNLIPKSQTEMNLGEKLKVPASLSSGFTPTPQTPNYKPLGETSSTTTTPVLTPDLTSDFNDYENLDFEPKSPSYENILTTISITYKSPVKARNSDNIYEDVELNPEKAGVPTTAAELPVQEATQPVLTAFPMPDTPVESPRLSVDEAFELMCSDAKEKLIPQSSTENSLTFEQSSKQSDFYHVGSSYEDNNARDTNPKDEVHRQGKMSRSSTENSLNLSSKQYDLYNVEDSNVKGDTIPRRGKLPNSSTENSLNQTDFHNSTSSRDSFNSEGFHTNTSQKAPKNPRNSHFFDSSSNQYDFTNIITPTGTPNTTNITQEELLKLSTTNPLNSPQNKSKNFTTIEPNRTNFAPNKITKNPVEFSLNFAQISASNRPDLLNLTSNYESQTYDSLNSTPLTPFDGNSEKNLSKKSLITPTDEMSMSEVAPTTSSFISSDSSGKYSKSPTLSPQISPMSSNSPMTKSSLDLDSPKCQTDKSDKRKSCDDEILDDIYQQVKYFRRSVHEINSLLDSEKINQSNLTKSKSFHFNLNSFNQDPKSMENDLKIREFHTIDSKLKSSNSHNGEYNLKINENDNPALKLKEYFENSTQKQSSEYEKTVENLRSKNVDTNSSELETEHKLQDISKLNQISSNLFTQFDNSLKQNSTDNQKLNNSSTNCGNSQNIKKLESIESEHKLTLNLGNPRTSSEKLKSPNVNITNSLIKVSKSTENLQKPLKSSDNQSIINVTPNCLQNSSSDFENKAQISSTIIANYNSEKLTNFTIDEQILNNPNIYENIQNVGADQQYTNSEQNISKSPIFDSLEAETNIQIYENIESQRPNCDNTRTEPKIPDLQLCPLRGPNLDLSRSRMHENEPKKLDLVTNLAVCSKCNDVAPEKKSNVRNLTHKFEVKEDDKVIETPKPKHNYEKDNLPPCLRAKNAKNSIKTRSLDENAFVTEFGRASVSLQRRKSLDDRTSSYINSKLLVEPQKMSTSTIDVRLDSQKALKPSLETLSSGTEQKLNRERIEKYKEERRNFLREKYRSESFKEDKDKLLLRLKHQKSFKSKNDEIETTKDELNQDKLQLDTLSLRLNHKDGDLKPNLDHERSQNKLPDNLNSRLSQKDTIELKFSSDSKTNLELKGAEVKPNLESKISETIKQTDSSRLSHKDKKYDLKPGPDFKTNSDCSASKSTNNFELKPHLDTILSKPNTDRLSNKEAICKKLPQEALSKFEKDGAVTKSFRKHHSPLMDRKNRPSLKEISDKILDESIDESVILRGPKEDEFLRLRRSENESERRRHTYDLYRERDFDSETNRRTSLENKTPRKEKCSPSYCIKDMKAIFESKSQQ